MSETISCAVCGSRALHPLVNRGNEYLQCEVCGFLFRSGPVSQEDVTQFYTSEGGNPLQQVDRAKRALHLRVLRRAERRLGGPGRLLDVGASSGAFLRTARDRGWEVAGVEPVEELVDAARGVGLDVRRGTLDDVEFEPHSFDLITHWDVLVLIENPLKELAQVRELLTDRGLWYARLRQHAVLRALDALWPLDGGLLGVRNPVVYHPFNYEPRTVRRLLAETGMTGRVEAGRLTAGDAYGTARGWVKSLLTAAKTLVDVFSRVIDQVTNGQLLLSPTMEVWARR